MGAVHHVATVPKCNQPYYVLVIVESCDIINFTRDCIVYLTIYKVLKNIINRLMVQIFLVFNFCLKFSKIPLN